MADFCDFKKILSYRSVWMALAALWVVYHHISLTPPCAFLQVLKSCGAGVVDIFVFASGLGCYHSLKKNPDTLIFIKKRLIKIVPAYYLCVTPWVIFDGIRLGTTVQGVVATYLGVDSLFGLGLQTLWYVNGLVVYYILVLFFVPLCLRGNFKTKLLGFCFCILLTVPFLGDTMRLMLFARVPLLYLGVCAADYGSRYPTLTKRTVLALLGAMAAGITILLVCYYRCHEYLYPYGLLWWPFILIVPGLCLLLSWLSMLVERTAPIVIRFLRYVGGCTLEIYIVHMFVFHAARRAMDAGIFYGTDKRWLLITAASFLFAFLASAAAFRISKFLAGKL